MRSIRNAVRFVVLVGLMNLLNLLVQGQQAVTTVGNPSIDAPWWNQAKDLTLSGAMVIAIAVLWRNLQAKDAALIAATKTVTEALAAAAAAQTEMRAILKESVEAKLHLSGVIDRLGSQVEKLAGPRT